MFEPTAPGTETDDERERCLAARAGDRRALGELLMKHGPRLYRQVLLPRLGLATHAEEALAATYLEVIKSMGGFEWQGVGLYPWLRRVALRVALRSLRRSKGETLCDPHDMARELEELDVAAQEFADGHDQARARGYVERSLEGLAAQHAEALRLRFLEERSREELAARWQVSLNAVDQRVHRAKAALRANLRNRNETRVSSPLVFILVDSGQTASVHVFNRGQVSIGRAPDSDLKLPGDGVSRRHALLTVDAAGAGYWLTDLGSSNGTLLRGAPVCGRARLSPGETLRVGGYRLSLATSPLLSLWARALLAEQGHDDPSDMKPASIAPSALLPTTPLSQVLRRRDALAAADSLRSTATEERIETLLRAAWRSGELADDFNAEAVNAALELRE